MILVCILQKEQNNLMAGLRATNEQSTADAQDDKNREGGTDRDPESKACYLYCCPKWSRQLVKLLFSILGN